jgi:SAM-dependent methyltransferase
MVDAYARVHVLRAGLELGLFEALRRPERASALAERLGLAPDLTEAWLHAAEAQGLVSERDGAFEIGGLVRMLLEAPEGDSLRAMIDQVVLGWGPRLEELPRLLKGAERPLHGSPEESARVARASRIVEPRALAALARIPGVERAHRVLDVGCGHGHYLAAFLQRHRDAMGVGIELDPAVAELARRRLLEAEVSRRAEIRVGDFLALDLPPGSFDLVMMNNDLYYFPPARHAELFRRVRARLAPGGVLAIQSQVRSHGWLSRWIGSAASSAVFDLLLRTHRNLYGLPDVAVLKRELREAGFEETGEVDVLPGGGSKFVYGRAPREAA